MNHAQRLRQVAALDNAVTDFKRRPFRSVVTPSRSDGRPSSRLAVVAPSHGKGQSEESEIDRCVERICAQGCKVVYQCIEQLRSGTEVADVHGLSGRQIELLLAELESIMAVYAENGSACLTGGAD